MAGWLLNVGRCQLLTTQTLPNYTLQSIATFTLLLTFMQIISRRLPHPYNITSFQREYRSYYQ
jgi:hypothetical protein